jgi:hypothetical protein
MATEFVTADPGSGGSNFAMDTETVGTVSVVHPISKIEWGPEDAFTLVNTGTASLPMQGAAAENAAVAGNPVLVAGRYDSSARTLGDGDAGAVALDALGQMLVSGTLTVGNTVTVASHAVTNAGTFAVQAVQSGAYNITNISGTVSLPTGAATAAKQPALGTAGSASSDVITVQGVASMTPILVNATGSGDVPITLAGETVVLGAGSAAIGKLAANSGVDIGDVDVTSIAAGSNLIGDVGISGARTSGGTTIFRSIDLDETEEQVKATAGQLYWIHATNQATAARYLKVYNATAANVTVGTTTPVLTFAIPTQGDSKGAGFVLGIPNGIAFGTAITVAATTGVADNDTGAPGANEVIVNLGYA